MTAEENKIWTSANDFVDEQNGNSLLSRILYRTAPELDANGLLKILKNYYKC